MSAIEEVLALGVAALHELYLAEQDQRIGAGGVNLVRAQEEPLGLLDILQV